LRESKPGAYDINLELQLKANSVTDYKTIARTNLRYMYWSMAQQLAHHSINGCNLRPGDMCGSGTISGPVSVLHLVLALTPLTMVCL
jgi:fumarylacetoacetase